MEIFRYIPGGSGRNLVDFPFHSVPADGMERTSSKYRPIMYTLWVWDVNRILDCAEKTDQSISDALGMFIEDKVDAGNVVTYILHWDMDYYVQH